MSKLKNPVIKLFGKTISIRPDHAEAHHHHEEQTSSSALIENKSTPGEDFVGSRLEAYHINPTVDEPVELEMPSTASETIETPVASGDTLSPKDTRRGEQTENSDYTEKSMKKPEKILPCPRCSSMETKFCYYNNYNVKQPRHFCKSCQRFWTVGGSMRNVAVGSGRRKNKGYCSSTTDHAKGPEGLTSPQGNGPQLSCFYSSPWPSNWNAVHFSSPASQDATFPSRFAVNLYPANSYCISAGPWGQPSLISPNLSLASTNPTSPLGKHRSDGSLLQLNSDKGSSATKSGAQRYVMPNKALKLDDLNDAATSCIRSLMSGKDNNESSFTGSSHFKSFYPIVDGKHHIVDNSLILQANPAAFSRSMNFHERS